MFWVKEDEIILAETANKYRVLDVAKCLLNGANVDEIDSYLAYGRLVSYSTEATWRIIANAFMFLRLMEEKYGT
jgi:hypothetical protein